MEARFPQEFSVLLREDLAESGAETGAAEPTFAETGSRMAWFPQALRPAALVMSLRLLERHLLPLLRPVEAALPKSTEIRSGRNYEETLPKVVRNRTAFLNPSRSRAARRAREIGLLPMMTSESLCRFAETVSGFELERDVGCQVICYEPGDYVGPHTDHHPQEPHLRDGYVDLHISLCRRSVEHQWLVYEDRGHLSKMVDVSAGSGVLVSHLPFWHYTTPLVAKKGKDSYARRWLLLSSFVIRR